MRLLPLPLLESSLPRPSSSLRLRWVVVVVVVFFFFHYLFSWDLASMSRHWLRWWSRRRQKNQHSGTIRIRNGPSSFSFPSLTRSLTHSHSLCPPVMIRERFVRRYASVTSRLLHGWSINNIIIVIVIGTSWGAFLRLRAGQLTDFSFRRAPSPGVCVCVGFFFHIVWMGKPDMRCWEKKN